MDGWLACRRPVVLPLYIYIQRTKVTHPPFSVITAIEKPKFRRGIAFHTTPGSRFNVEPAQRKKYRFDARSQFRMIWWKHKARTTGAQPIDMFGKVFSYMQRFWRRQIWHQTTSTKSMAVLVNFDIKFREAYQKWFLRGQWVIYISRTTEGCKWRNV